MPAPYSQDLRQKVLHLYQKEKLPKTEIAKRFCVSRSFVQDLLRLYQEQGSVEPRPHGGGNPPLMTQEHIEYVCSLLEEQVDLRLDDLCLALFEKFQITVSISTMSQTLLRHGITRKKKPGILLELKKRRLFRNEASSSKS